MTLGTSIEEIIVTPSALRQLLRWTHIASSAIVGTYLYSPFSENAVFAALTLYVVFPFMALSGIAMWRQAAVMRLLGRR